MSDSLTGKLVLLSTSGFFLYVVFWLTLLPFTNLEEDHWFYNAFLDQNIALVLFSSFGFVFIGSLMIFTLYHLRIK